MITIIVIAAVSVGVFIYVYNSENPSTAVSGDNIIINEFMASNSSSLLDDKGEYSDWIEVYNPTDTAVSLAGLGLSDDNTTVKWAFPNIVLEAKSYFVVFASGENISKAGAPYQHTGFKLNAGSGGIYMTDTAGQIMDQVEYTDQIENISLGRNPEDMAKWVSFENPTPGYANDEAGYEAFMQSRVVDDPMLKITEVMSSNLTTMTDNNGHYNDYIEIYNAGDKTADLSGCGLSDDPEKLMKWTFPDVSIEPGQHFVVFASGEDTLSTDVSAGVYHTNFKISAYQETITLSNPYGMILDQVAVIEVEPDFAYARILGESGYSDEWEQTALPTPGYRNDEQGYDEFEQNNPLALGAVVISEVMVSNAVYLEEEGEYYDWIEIHNTSNEPVDITGYGLTDDSSNPAKWRFPEMTLDAGAYTVVLASGLADNDDVKKKLYTYQL